MIAVKRQPLESPPDAATPQMSGKLVLVGVIVVAFAGAAVSWFFRYHATHRAIEFWGSKVALLIRDAPVVTLFEDSDAVVPATKSQSGTTDRTPPRKIDVSQAHGLTHLRNALLENESFDWSAATLSPTLGKEDVYDQEKLSWRLSFFDPATNEEATILFVKDCRWASSLGVKRISTEPIAKGLREMFDEFSAKPGAKPAEQSR